MTLIPARTPIRVSPLRNQRAEVKDPSSMCPPEQTLVRMELNVMNLSEQIAELILIFHLHLYVFWHSISIRML